MKTLVQIFIIIAMALPACAQRANLQYNPNNGETAQPIKLGQNQNANSKSILNAWELSLKPQDLVGTDMFIRNPDGHAITLGDSGSVYATIYDTGDLNVGSISGLSNGINSTGTIAASGADGRFEIQPSDGSGTTFTLRNVTGDEFRLSNGPLSTTYLKVDATTGLVSADGGFLTGGSITSNTASFGGSVTIDGGAADLRFGPQDGSGETFVISNLDGENLTFTDASGSTTYFKVDTFGTLTATSVVALDTLTVTGGATFLGGASFLQFNAFSPADGTGTSFVLRNDTGDSLKITNLSITPTTYFEVDPTAGVKAQVGLVVGTSGQRVTAIYSNAASVDWPSISAGTYSTMTMTVTGASTTNTPTVELGWGAALEQGINFIQAWVSGANTVSITLINNTGLPYNPAPITIRATVKQF